MNENDKNITLTSLLNIGCTLILIKQEEKISISQTYLLANTVKHWIGMENVMDTTHFLTGQMAILNNEVKNVGDFVDASFGNTMSNELPTKWKHFLIQTLMTFGLLPRKNERYVTALVASFGLPLGLRFDEIKSLVHGAMEDVDYYLTRSYPDAYDEGMEIIDDAISRMSLQFEFTLSENNP